MNTVLHEKHKYHISEILHNNNVYLYKKLPKMSFCVPNEKATYRVNSWVPEPREAANRDLYLGYLNTSPWMYFHPVSSWSSADSSSWAYLL
jgi:hypothetical protein